MALVVAVVHCLLVADRWPVQVALSSNQGLIPHGRCPQQSGPLCQNLDHPSWCSARLALAPQQALSGVVLSAAVHKQVLLHRWAIPTEMPGVSEAKGCHNLRPLSQQLVPAASLRHEPSLVESSVCVLRQEFSFGHTGGVG